MSVVKSLSKRFKYYWSEKNPVFLTRLMFLVNFRKILNLSKPRDINEKLHYLKLYVYNDNPLITRCVDKYRVKEYLSEKNIDGLHVANNYSHIMKSGEEIRGIWDSLPDSFVVKCNHGCGFNILVKDKNKENIDSIVNTIDEWLLDEQWKMYCEPQYKNVDKGCFIEEYLGDDVEAYKFYCFNGKPEVVYVSSKGDTGIQDYYLDYYDKNWNWLDINLDGHGNLGPVANKPELYDEMLRIARALALEFPFVRVDLYEVGGRVYFSELTFVPTGGNMKLKPRYVVDEWGKMLDLSVTNMGIGQTY